MKRITVILIAPALIILALLVGYMDANAADANPHHTPTPPAPTATPQPPTPVPPLPPLPVTPQPTPEPEPTPLADYFIPLVNWNLQSGGLPLRLASATQTGALWIPFAAKDVQIKYWFTLEELDDAESRIPQPLEFWAEYVDCELYPDSDPEILIQLWYCTQPETVDADGNPVGNRFIYFWFEPATDRVEWVIVSAIQMVQP